MKHHKYPRNLEEAFGPYARGPISDEDKNAWRLSDLCVAIACIAGLITVILVL